MIIDRLELINFKRFRHEVIRFRDGITGILGNNGTGKSSIVQAIFFALYGVQATGIAADYIVSSFASPKEKCEVRLDFRIGGENYAVVRTFKKGKTIQHDASFFKDQKERAKGVSDVDTEVRRTLGMGPVDFKNTIYAAQKDLLVLLENTPGKRKEWFLRALGIDYLNTESQKILREKADETTGQLRSLEGELKAITRQKDEIDISALLETIKTFKSDLESLEKQQADLKIRKRHADEEYATFQDKKNEFTRLVERQNSLTREKTGLIRQRDAIQSKLIDLARKEQEYRVLEQKTAAIPEKRKALEELRTRKGKFDQTTIKIQFCERDCSETRKRTGQLEKRIEALDTEAKTRASLITGIRKALQIGDDVRDDDLEQYVASADEKITTELASLSSRVKSLAQEKKKLLSDWETIQHAGAEGICPLCRQKLGSHYTSIEFEFTSQIRRIDKETAELHDQQKITQKVKEAITLQKPDLIKVRSLSEKVKARDDFDADYRELLAALEEKEQMYHSLTQGIQDLNFDEKTYAHDEKEMAELEKDLKRFNDLREQLAQVSVYKKQVGDFDIQANQKQADIDIVVNEIKQSSFDPKKIEILERNREEIDSAIRDVGTETSRTAERLRQADEKIAEFKRTEEFIRDLQKKEAELKEEIELIRLTRGIIADYVIYLMQVVRSRIEGEVSRIISEITSGRYDQVLLDEDFNLLVRDIDNDYAIDRFSGGEQDDIAVALRIALSRYLAELHNVHESTILIFDEIFGSQDEERRNNLLTTLRSQESRFPQILLISHIPEMQGEFSNTLIVEMGTDQSSHIREVSG